jgi:hypothetical protein
MLNWWRRQHALGFVIVMASLLLGGTQLGTHVGSIGPAQTEAATTTLERTTVKHRTKLVTVKVKGRVIRRVDHLLVVQVARQVFHTHTTPSRRIVVPRHVVRILRRPATASEPILSLVQGVAPAPVTVFVPTTVTVPVDVPGPTVTQTDTVTQTVPSPPVTVTITVTVPLDTTGGLDVASH